MSSRSQHYAVLNSSDIEDSPPPENPFAHQGATKIRLIEQNRDEDAKRSKGVYKILSKNTLDPNTIPPLP